MAGPVAEITRILQRSADRPHVDGVRPFPGLRDEIRFDAVAFAYTQEVPVVRDVSFSVPRGTTTALIGHTGAGKTTLIRLLLRFYDPDQGAVTIDGVDVREFQADSLRRHIALVSQDTLMLHATIRENLTYGLDGVTPAALDDALERARLANLVRRLPQGLDTQVGDRGTTLSGGERQRIAIARAMLKRADILVLDEATSALDAVTEQAIQDAIAELLHGTTSIVIAHRLSTIQRADQIVVLEGGRVVQQGTAADLLRGAGNLAHYWTGGGSTSQPESARQHGPRAV
jgi:subfamily B ATP-binding cassette protein MsbA